MVKVPFPRCSIRSTAIASGAKIEIDDALMRCLQQLGMTLQSVPQPIQTVFLRPTANLSTGGTAIDRTDQIHPENALIAHRAARIIGFDIAGIDFISRNIRSLSVRLAGASSRSTRGQVSRCKPFRGRPRNVARPVLKLLFPPGSNSRIQIFAITGAIGISTTCRMLGHILQHAGATVGLTFTTSIHLNDNSAKGWALMNVLSARS